MEFLQRFGALLVMGLASLASLALSPAHAELISTDPPAMQAGTQWIRDEGVLQLKNGSTVRVNKIKSLPAKLDAFEAKSILRTLQETESRSTKRNSVHRQFLSERLNHLVTQNTSSDSFWRTFLDADASAAKRPRSQSGSMSSLSISPGEQHIVACQLRYGECWDQAEKWFEDAVWVCLFLGLFNGGAQGLCEAFAGNYRDEMQTECTIAYVDCVYGW